MNSKQDRCHVAHEITIYCSENASRRSNSKIVFCYCSVSEVKMSKCGAFKRICLIKSTRILELCQTKQRNNIISDCYEIQRSKKCGTQGNGRFICWLFSIYHTQDDHAWQFSDVYQPTPEAVDVNITLFDIDQAIHLIKLKSSTDELSPF